jgi:hypothetical protein
MQIIFFLAFFRGCIPNAMGFSLKSHWEKMNHFRWRLRRGCVLLLRNSAMGETHILLRKASNVIGSSFTHPAIGSINSFANWCPIGDNSLAEMDSIGDNFADNFADWCFEDRSFVDTGPINSFVDMDSMDSSFVGICKGNFVFQATHSHHMDLMGSSLCLFAPFG